MSTAIKGLNFVVGVGLAVIGAALVFRKAGGRAGSPFDFVDKSAGYFIYPWFDKVGGIQPASHVWETIVWGNGQDIGDPRRGGNLGEDDNWDRQYCGYLLPGETAIITVPLLPLGYSIEEPNCGGCGLAAWFASDSPNVHGNIASPYDNFDFIPRTLGERGTGEKTDYQEWRALGGFANQGTKSAGNWLNGPIDTGAGNAKFPNLYKGGLYTITVTNHGAANAGVAIRVFAGQAAWLRQAQMYPRSDMYTNIMPVAGWPCYIDGRIEWLNTDGSKNTAGSFLAPEDGTTPVMPEDFPLNINVPGIGVVGRQLNHDYTELYK